MRKKEGNIAYYMVKVLNKNIARTAKAQFTLHRYNFCTGTGVTVQATIYTVPSIS